MEWLRKYFLTSDWVWIYFLALFFKFCWLLLPIKLYLYHSNFKHTIAFSIKSCFADWFYDLQLQMFVTTFKKIIVNVIVKVTNMYNQCALVIIIWRRKEKHCQMIPEVECFVCCLFCFYFLETFKHHWSTLLILREKVWSLSPYSTLTWDPFKFQLVGKIS